MNICNCTSAVHLEYTEAKEGMGFHWSRITEGCRITMWVLGTDPRDFEGAASSLVFWAFFPTPVLFLNYNFTTFTMKIQKIRLYTTKKIGCPQTNDDSCIFVCICLYKKSRRVYLLWYQNSFDFLLKYQLQDFKCEDFFTHKSNL